MVIKIRKYLETFWRAYVLILAPIVLLPIILRGMAENDVTPLVDLESNSTDALFAKLLPPQKSEYEPMVCAYVLLLMAIYW